MTSSTFLNTATLVPIVVSKVYKTLYGIFYKLVKMLSDKVGSAIVNFRPKM